MKNLSISSYIKYLTEAPATFVGRHIREPRIPKLMQSLRARTIPREKLDDEDDAVLSKFQALGSVHLSNDAAEHMNHVIEKHGIIFDHPITVFRGVFHPTDETRAHMFSAKSGGREGRPFSTSLSAHIAARFAANTEPSSRIDPGAERRLLKIHVPAGSKVFPVPVEGRPHFDNEYEIILPHYTEVHVANKPHGVAPVIMSKQPYAGNDGESYSRQHLEMYHAIATQPKNS